MITTGSGNGVELVLGQIREFSTRYAQGVVELVVRVVHLIDTHHGFQAALIKRLVVGHEGQAFNQRLYLRPHLGKDGSFFRIFTAEAMHLAAPVVIVVRLRLNERIERIHYLAISHNDNTYRTNAAALVVGCLKIYRCKIPHTVCAKWWQR